MASINVIRAGYAVDLGIRGVSSFDPVDATTYYFGGPIGTHDTASVNRRVYLPYAGTIIAALAYVAVGGTLSSGEDTTAFIRLNDTSNTTIATTLETNTTHNIVVNTALSIAVSAGDFIALGLTFPTFVTNPTLVFTGGWAFIAV